MTDLTVLMVRGLTRSSTSTCARYRLGVAPR
jgi:hypothetical protein